MNIEQARIAGAGHNDKTVIIRSLFSIGVMAAYRGEKYRCFRFVIDEIGLLYLASCLSFFHSYQPSAITITRP